MPRRGPDLSRLRRLFTGPGTDTRINLTLGQVVNEQPTGFDAANGIYVDVQFIPTDETETCLVGSLYAGRGFGIYAPLAAGDLVLVALPGGDADYGPVVVSRMWNGAAPPPAEAKAAQQDNGDDVPVNDLVVRVKDGQKLTVVVSGGGDVDVTVQGSGNVNLVVDQGQVCLGAAAGASSLQKAALGQAIADYFNSLAGTAPPGWLATHTHSGGTISGNTGAPLTPPPTVPTVTASKVQLT